MRILVLADDLGGDDLSPPGLWLGELAPRWATRGHRLTVLCAPRPGSDLRSDPPGVPGLEAMRPEPDRFEAALGEILEQSPDVLHVSGHGPYGVRVLEILRRLPVLLDVHDLWPICPQHDLLRRPWLTSCPDHFPFSGCSGCAGVLRLRAMDQRTELISGARLLVAHSAFARARLEAALRRPVELLGYGVDPLRFRPDCEPPRSDSIRALYETRERHRVLFLGPPTVGRGVERVTDLLVALVARLPEVELIVAGRDPESPGRDQIIRRELREMGLLDRARLLGSVPPGDLPALYASCTVAVAPGPAPDPGGLFVLQALASGLPVVAQPGGAHDEYVEHGETGWLVDARDLPAFANAVTTLLIDPGARAAFGESGRLAAMERHDFERSVFALEELHHRVRSDPGAAAA